MKVLVNILIIIGLACYVLAVVSKLAGGVLYAMDIKPLAAMVFGNGCLLLAFAFSNIKK